MELKFNYVLRIFTKNIMNVKEGRGTPYILAVLLLLQNPSLNF
jgi:hypothetical protein